MAETPLADRGDTSRDEQGAEAPGDDRASVNIGLRLYNIRKSRRLTLQEASAATGVSASAFSKIERNELSPTLSTIKRIAEGLGLELTALLTEHDGETAPVTVTGRRSINRAGTGRLHATGTCSNLLLSADMKNKRATPVLTRVTARSPDEYPAWAKSDAEIFVMVLEGTLVVHSALYEPLELFKGDSVYYDATTEHTWTSAGPGDAVVLWVLVNI